MTVELDPRIPNTSTTWQLWYQDTFDRDAPPSLEAAGKNIIQGLYELWLHILEEGILDDGNATFSTFYLTWGNSPSTRADAGVQSFRNLALKKLRQWSNLARQDKREHFNEKKWIKSTHENVIVWKLAKMHFYLLQRSNRWKVIAIDCSEEAKELLARVDLISEPGQL